MANIHNQANILNLGPPTRLIRQAGILGRCSYCGVMTHESCNPKVSKHFHYNCYQHILIHNPNFHIEDRDNDELFGNNIE